MRRCEEVIRELQRLQKELEELIWTYGIIRRREYIEKLLTPPRMIPAEFSPPAVVPRGEVAPMPRRKSKPKEPETSPQPTELPAQPTTAPTIPTATEATTATERLVEKPATGKLEIKEATWEEFEKFQAQTRSRERPKSPLRQAFEMAASGKVIRIDGLSPAQVRAVLALISVWNRRFIEAPVQVKYDVRAGVVYLAPAKKPEEKKQ
jgi:cytoskeletal protein RodZ